jgi:hypothetical protein
MFEVNFRIEVFFCFSTFTFVCLESSVPSSTVNAFIFKVINVRDLVTKLMFGGSYIRIIMFYICFKKKRMRGVGVNVDSVFTAVLTYCVDRVCFSCQYLRDAPRLVKVGAVVGVNVDGGVCINYTNYQARIQRGGGAWGGFSM